MRLFNKWLHLDKSRRLLVIEAAFLVITVRLGMRFLPFGMMNRFVRYLSRPAHSNTGDVEQSPEMVVWAVEGVGPVLLGQNACLTEALAGQILLGRRGISSRLRIGVKKTDDGRLFAHAWLEGEHGILLGGSSSDLQRFVALPDLEIAGG